MFQTVVLICIYEIQAEAQLFTKYGNMKLLWDNGLVWQECLTNERVHLTATVVYFLE